MSRRTLTLSAGCAPSEPTALTGSSSSVADTSSTCSASTGAITTNTGHTARSSSCHPKAALRDSSTERAASIPEAWSADSPANTRPPEFPTPTGDEGAEAERGAGLVGDVDESDGDPL